ncbi:DUF6603 domain-containing protein [Blastococcus deserti]|uniref:DUF6603 domain-containing protein n=1 Tax=Blastococcus deserti TaxID=2259033 RepID=A0ABW4XH51_9ACTN
MTEARTFVDALLGAVLDAMAPLEDALADPVLLQALLEELGWVIDPGPIAPAQLQARIPVGDLLTAFRDTLDAVRTGNADPELYAALATTAADLFALLAALGDGVAPPQLPAPLSDDDFWDRLAADMVGFLIVRHLRAAKPILFAVLHLTGVIDRAAAPAGENRIEGHRRVVLRWDRLGPLIEDPGMVVAEVYGWGGTFDCAELLERLRMALRALGLWTTAVESDGDTIATYYGSATAPDAPDRELRVVLASTATDEGLHAEVGLSVLGIPAQNGVAGPPAGLLVSLYVEGEATAAIELTDNITATLEGVVDADRLVGVELRPDGVGFADTAAVEARAGIRLEFLPPEPALMLGGREGTRAEVGSVLIGLGGEGGTGGFDVSLRGELSGLRVVVALADADAFVGGLLGSGELSLAADLTVIWSRRDGLHVGGQAALRFTLPLTLVLGPVTVQRLELEAAVRGSGLAVSAALTAAGRLGPLAVTVDGIGAELRLAPGPAGVAGLSPSLAFRPPRGAGLVIEGPTVSGGGFLLFDEVRQEYAGILQLRFAGLGLSAIGLITTQPGEFSLLVIISVEFSPIQLGYGFTLNGVGGLLALNRTIDVRAIQEGLAHGALDAFLFPPDPVGNAAQLIADLNRYFPSAQGQFVFGPSVVLGWGTPTLLTITLGVLLELPSPLRVLLAGRLRMVLPDEASGIVRITVDLLGNLDLTNGKLEIDAGLRDSQVAGFAIAGDMAMRASWGREPGFLLAAGGFNPRYRPPGSVRKLERLSIALGTSENPRLRLEAYLAVTSNTVQFGARLDLHAAADLGIGTFSLAATVGFDALIQFSPLSFVVDIYAGIVLKWNDAPFLGVWLQATLSGPQPWRACGEATFSFLGTHSVGFEVTVGDEPPPQPPVLVNVLDRLREALLDPRNWEAQHPADSRRTIVMLRQPAVNGPRLVVHPLGSLTVRQQVVPLSTEITRFGAGRPDAGRFEFALRAPDGSTRNPDVVVEARFARAQFFDVSDDEKLIAPAFDPMPCGGTFGGEDIRVPATGIQDYGGIAYEERVLDVDDAPGAGTPAPRPLAEPDLARLTLAGAAARNGAAGTRDALLLGEPVEITTRPAEYRVVDLGGMAPVDDGPLAAFGSATALLRRRVAARPELAEGLAVVLAHEVAP